MKRFIIALLILIKANAFAQKTEAFLCRDSADAKRIAALVMENAAGDYHLVKTLNRKNDTYIEYLNNARDVIKIHFQLLSGGGMMLTGIKGKYEDIFPFWKNNFETDADIIAVAKTGKGKVLKIPFLQGKAIYYFIRQAGSDWYMRGIYEADRNKQ